MSESIKLMVNIATGMVVHYDPALAASGNFRLQEPLAPAAPPAPPEPPADTPPDTPAETPVTTQARRVSARKA